MDLADKYLKIVGKRKLYPPLNGYSIFLQGSEYNTQRYFKKWYEDKVRQDLFIHIKEGFSQVWLPEDDVRFESIFGFKEYLNDSKKFDERIRHTLRRIGEIDEIYVANTYEKIGKADWESLFSLVNKARDIIWDANAAAHFSVYLDRDMCNQVLMEEGYDLSGADFDAKWYKTVEPAFESFDKAQAKDFFELVIKNTPWNELVERCQYFLTDYHSARSTSEVERMLRERYKNSIDNPKIAATLLESEHEHVENVVDSHEAWLNELPEKKKKIARYLQTVMKIRDRRKNFFAKGMTIMYRVAERMFKEAGVDRDLITFYSVRELLLGVDRLKASANDLKERKKGFQWMVPYVGEVQELKTDISHGVEKINAYYRECHTQADSSGSVKGQPAFKGIVRGRVRVVLDMNSEHGFSEGEILVAGMTRPEYVPLMKKAAAIVTDEGGITCHAAIVSRELKKPCVIGTKIATKVLKDGDMVEVDAEKGIVRIIK
jgi:phosphohistidine swiveling domain-containing protein